jgi:Holliday junction resolvase
MSHYRAGRDFEHAVRAALVSDGYDVIRSAGSKTKVDLAAFKAGQALFVRCKRDGRISPAERVELLRMPGTSEPSRSWPGSSHAPQPFTIRA